MLEQIEMKKNLSLELWMDIDYCSHALERCEHSEAVQFYRRAFVRAAFAYIEGTIFDFRLGVLNAHRRSDTPEFSAPDLALLEDKELYLNEHGQFAQRRAKASLAPLIKFSFRVLMAAKRVYYEPNYKAEGWASLEAAIKLRDRLMHPKSVAEIEISDEQLAEVRAGLSWFYREVENISWHVVARGAVGDAEYEKMIEEREASRKS